VSPDVSHVKQYGPSVIKSFEICAEILNYLSVAFEKCKGKIRQFVSLPLFAHITHILFHCHNRGNINSQFH
jgi:hypothetical protein